MAQLREITDPQKFSLINETIDEATPSRLRTVLRELVKESNDDLDRICRKLLVEDDDVEQEIAGEEHEKVGTKRKRKGTFTGPRYQICVQCKEEYDVLDNPPDCCTWHDGDLDPDFEGDFWADHDEEIHGTIDSEELRKEYPEGYIWSCCQRSGEYEGCKSGVHRSERDGSSTKKLRSL